MKAKAATIGLAHPFEVWFDNAAELLDKTSRAIVKIGVDCIETGVILKDYESVKEAAKKLNGIDFDVLVVCVATWSEDHHLLDFTAFHDVPMVIRAFPHRETGSLCCAHQIGAVFTELGRKYEFVFGEADSEACAEQTKQIASAYALSNSMKKMKTGSIGGRVKGMTEISYDEFDIKQKLGARVVNIDEQELIESVSAVNDEEADRTLKLFKNRPYKFSSKESDLRESIKYYVGLKKLVSEYDLNCLAVKCYTKYMGKVCVGYSLLAEEGIMCACEGDVTNSLSMQMLYELSEKPINNTDLLYLDEKQNTILYAHCGSSGYAIADGEVEIAPVRLAENGCCSLFTAIPGKVTLINIVGHGDAFRISTKTGDAVRCGMEFPGNPVVVRYDKAVSQINNEIMRQGVGHHWMVGYGNHASIIEKFCEINKIKYISI